MHSVYKSLLFEYKRGNEFYTKIAVNPHTGNTSYHDTRYPAGTPAEVKEAFLTEADEAVMRKLILLDEEATSYNPWAYGGD